MYQYLFYVDSILRKKTEALSLFCFIQNGEVYSFDIKMQQQQQHLATTITTTTTTKCQQYLTTTSKLYFSIELVCVKSLSRA
jgi:hypothetical protein